MKKTRQKILSRPGVQALICFVLVAGLLAAAFWVWPPRRHSPASGSHGESGWLPDHKSNRWECIVIHHSADESGSAAKYDRIHREQNGWDELGYHFVIGNGSLSGDGEVEVGPRWVKQKYGAHCKTDDGFYNEHGIGICLVGNLNNHPPTPRQMQSLARLVRFLCTEFHIPSSQILTHGGVTGKTECPGKQFDLAALKKRLDGDREIRMTKLE